MPEETASLEEGGEAEVHADVVPPTPKRSQKAR